MRCSTCARSFSWPRASSATWLSFQETTFADYAAEWIDSYQGLAGPLLIDAFGVFLMRQFMLKIPSDYVEAARIDGANEFRIIQLIVTPLLWPTITVVGTTMIINALKTFDIVYVMTNGAYDTDVIATQMFRQLQTAHYGRGAAVGVVLFIAIVPLLIVNIRRFQQQEEQR